MTIAKCELEKRFLVGAEQRDLKAVSSCLRLGVNPNARRTDRVTALHIAAERGDVELATILLEAKGLNLNPFTIHGYTPLIIACNSRQDEFVKFLLEHGANINIPERFGKTPLHHVAFMDCISIAKILIENNADLNVMDVFAHTPLSIAIVERSFLPMAKLLIEHGANIKLDRGELVLDMFLEACLGCASEKQLEVVIYLLDIGIDPNTRDKQTNRNGLHYFAINSYLPLGRTLGSWGTDSGHVDNYGLTPAKLAKQHSNKEAVAFLADLELNQKFDRLRNQKA